MKINTKSLKAIVKLELKALQETKTIKEGEMKRIHMAIMDRLAEIKAEFSISSEKIKVILDDLDFQEEYAAAAAPPEPMDI